MMTKKDYIRAAELIRTMYAATAGNDNLTSEVITTEHAFVDFFKGDNPRFSEDRFREACVYHKHPTKRGKS